MGRRKRRGRRRRRKISGNMEVRWPAQPQKEIKEHVLGQGRRSLFWGWMTLWAVQGSPAMSTFS
jgi:hypothetical protein